MKNNKLIKVKLDGKNITPGKMDARSLGLFLISFQSAMDKMIDKKAINFRTLKESSRLFLSKIGSGSVELTFEPSLQTTLDDHQVLAAAYDNFVDLSKEVNENPSEARKNLTERWPDSGDRLKLEMSFRHFMEADYNISFQKFTGETITIDPRKLVYISNWINEDTRIGNKEVRGVLLRIKGDEPQRYFSLKTDDGSIVKCYYKPELESSVLELFKKPLVAIGSVEKKLKLSNMKDVLELSPWLTDKLFKIDDLQLKNPIEYEISFEDDVWCLGVDVLRVHGCGYTYQEALERLKTNITELHELYTKEIPVETMSQSAKKILKYLQEVVGQ